MGPGGECHRLALDLLADEPVLAGEFPLSDQTYSFLIPDRGSRISGNCPAERKSSGHPGVHG